MKATAVRALDNLHGFITTALEVDANSQLESWIVMRYLLLTQLQGVPQSACKTLPRNRKGIIVLNQHVSHTQQKILELIGEWNYIYAQKSRYKDDFKHINDMYRLLEYKGYRFPRLNEAALNFEPDVNLKTEEQLEEEDRKNQGTKLEALIRKGTPAALAEANEMMKVMSGYDTSKKPDYKKEVSSELDRIESKVILLNDMLNQRTPEDFRMKSDATIEELYNSAKTAQTKLQKFIEENDDEDRLGRLLEMNDLINIVVQKYNDLKKGKAVQKNDFDRKEASQGSKPAEKGAINLIDFDDFGSLPPANSSSNPQDDVLGGIASLNFGAPVHNQFGQPNQFTQQTQFTPPVNQFAAPQQFMQQQPNQFVQPQLNQFNQPQLTGQGQLTPQQMPLNTQMSGGFDAFGGFGSQKPVSQTQPQQQKAASPFDDLLSMNDLKPAQNNSAPTQKNDLLGLFDSAPTQNKTGTPQQSFGTPNQSTPLSQMGAPQQFGMQQQTGLGMQQFGIQPMGMQNTGSSFSNLPGLNKEYVIFDKNGLQIKLQLPTPTAVPSIKAKAIFVNVTPVQFTGLNFQVALPKTMTVEMEPISSAVLAPLNQSPAAQVINIANPSKEPLRMRFKVQYAVNGAIVNENGEYALTV
ncbi:hypothetical protein HK103_000088 [Boothiomyces macroporosus]|uniref:Uncharacterized protein n=1 Tax=Boothiomyces macroporosus TaxID=261099 RepID=A0AAD5UN80_9FUNG|nr:hypothetical protein HK103_000088 [Boothiomyces macroporosus]